MPRDRERRRHRYVVLCAAWLLFADLAVLTVPAAERSGDTLVHDLGVVRSGPPVDLTFDLPLTVASGAQAPLPRLAVSCDACLRARWAEPTVAGSARLVLQLKTASLDGYFSRAVRITPIDPKQPDFEVILRGIAVPTLRACPARLDLGFVPAGETTSATVTIRPGWAPDRLRHAPAGSTAETWDACAPRDPCSGFALWDTFDVDDVSVRSGNRWLWPLPRETLEARNVTEYTVTLMLGPEAPVGPIQEQLVFACRGDKQLDLQVEVLGEVINPATAEPATVIFGPVPRGTSAEQRVAVMRHCQRPVAITAIRTDDPRVSCAPADGTSMTLPTELIVRWRSQGSAGMVRTRVVIATDHPRQPSLDIPIYVHIQDVPTQPTR